ncbi:hypothetical protein P2G88_07915 [Aliiglaciecola sp. CAU 1673]|uniref:hypothetical protein n=1 Tax=Aliiglaciecola sp. CAU 1673 TaxID=3032595 RepID=UPI0023DA8966|nr:hypothetical protein [Aliiglaciecola sp. CAU 1673]MDF2178177.1 hypothetical protein [Aliiglaciecola sp. CAU 1673]
MLLNTHLYADEMAEQVVIALNTIPDILEYKNSQAPYSKLLNRLSSKIQDRMVFHYYPAVRAAKAFNEEESDCLFPGSTMAAENEQPRIQSQPVNYAKAFFSLLLPCSPLRSSAKPLRN